MTNKTFLFPALALILLVCLAYARAPWNGTVWDDEFYLTKKHLASVEGLKRMWQEPTSTSHPYYPLTRTSFWIENRIWGEGLFVPHLTSILLHLMNTLLIWRILRILQVKGAWIAAAIFGVHPVAVESAAWIAERKNVLGVFFYLSSLLVFLKYRMFDSTDESNVGSKSFYYLSLVLFLASLLSKTAFCTLPVAILLIGWWKHGSIRKLDIRLTVPYFLLALILGVFTIFVEKHHTGAQGAEFQFSFLERCLIAGRAFWFYIAKIHFPSGINFMYPRWDIHITDVVAYVYPLAAIAVIVSLWIFREKIGRGPLVAVLFFVVTLLPAIGFINHFLMRYTFVADHLQYLPMVGIIVLTTSALFQFLSSRLPRFAYSTIWLAILLVLGFLTWRQTAIYKNNFVLYNDIIRKNPTCFMAFNNRGLIFLEAGKSDLALRDFNRAIELNPDFEEALVSRGHFYYLNRQYKEALADFDRAVKVNPNFDEAYRNRGAVFFVWKKYDLALADFNRALYLNPEYTRAYNARGVVFSVIRRFDLAMQDYDRAVQMDPGYSMAYVNRSKTLWELGQFDRALEDANKARSLGVPGMDQYILELKTARDRAQ